MSQQDSVSTVQEGWEAEERTEQLADFVVPPSRLEDTTSLKGGFGAIFGSHPAGVAVITAEGPDGPVGLTASSLSLVSADPPVSVNRRRWHRRPSLACAAPEARAPAFRARWIGS